MSHYARTIARLVLWKDVSPEHLPSVPWTRILGAVVLSGIVATQHMFAHDDVCLAPKEKVAHFGNLECWQTLKGCTSTSTLALAWTENSERERVGWTAGALPPDMTFLSPV